MSEPEKFMPVRQLLQSSRLVFTPYQRQVADSINEANRAWYLHSNLTKLGRARFRVGQARRRAEILSTLALRTVVAYYKKHDKLGSIHTGLKPHVEKTWGESFMREWPMHVRSAMSVLSVRVPPNLVRELQQEEDLAYARPQVLVRYKKRPEKKH